MPRGSNKLFTVIKKNFLGNKPCKESIYTFKVFFCKNIKYLKTLFKAIFNIIRYKAISFVTA